tara:strand:- start:6351 stop:6557 length:207 start_codon:yes stop_codon:yes gene_type:complete
MNKSTTHSATNTKKSTTFTLSTAEVQLILINHVKKIGGIPLVELAKSTIEATATCEMKITISPVKGMI